MGKSFNVCMVSKKAEGLARKEAAQALKADMENERQGQLETKQWAKGSKDESKKGMKNRDNQVLAQEEQKRLDKLAEKQARELLLAEEEKALPTSSLKKASKVSEKRTLKADQFAKENEAVDAYGASNLDDALSLLSISNDKAHASGKLEKHPEKRMKSAYAEFEAVELVLIKQENPGLRLSQIKQLMQKKWKKSPDNPMNQQHLAFDATRIDEQDFKAQIKDQAASRLKL